MVVIVMALISWEVSVNQDMLFVNFCIRSFWNLWNTYCCLLHFINDETEAQRSKSFARGHTGKWGRGGTHTPAAGKEASSDAGDLGLIPGLGRSPGEGKGHPLQYSDLENPMDYTVHRVAKNRTQLSDFHFLSPIYYALLNSFHLTTGSPRKC